jgi:hypothetical protein
LRRSRKTSRIVLLFGLLAALIALLGGKAAADGPGRAGIVVSFGDGRTSAACIEFAEDEITGAELLKRSGLPLVVAGGPGGAAVCKISDVGCDNPGDCFCACNGADCRYWAYYTLEAGAWKYSNVGSSQRKVTMGDIDGWAWGSGKAGEGAQPELLTFDQICPVATATPPPTAVPPVDTPPPAPSPVTHPTSESPAPTPAPTATASPPATATSIATAASPTKTVAKVLGAQKTPEAGNDEASGFPLELAGFGLLAAALGTASILLWRRSRVQ